MKKFKQIVEKTIEEVKRDFPNLNAVAFGAYYEANQYFVAYIFKTNQALSEAKEKGIIDKIKIAHREKMISNGYPIESIKECIFATQEDCDNEYGGNWYYYFK